MSEPAADPSQPPGDASDLEKPAPITNQGPSSTHSAPTPVPAPSLTRKQKKWLDNNFPYPQRAAIPSHASWHVPKPRYRADKPPPYNAPRLRTNSSMVEISRWMMAIDMNHELETRRDAPDLTKIAWACTIVTRQLQSNWVYYRQTQLNDAPTWDDFAKFICGDHLDECDPKSKSFRVIVELSALRQDGKSPLDYYSEWRALMSISGENWKDSKGAVKYYVGLDDRLQRWYLNLAGVGKFRSAKAVAQAAEIKWQNLSRSDSYDDELFDD